MKAILTSDGSIKIILSADKTENSETIKENFLSKEKPSIKVAAKPSLAAKAPIDLKKVFQEEDDEDNRYAQYKQTPRQTFLSTVCHVCKVNLSRYFLCLGCKMVSYCKEDHLKVDYLNHKGLCLAIQLIAKRRGGHVYNMSKNLSEMEFRNLKSYTIFLCEQFLNRILQPFEREIFLFPRLCHESSCREWRNDLLIDCKKCEQVSHCSVHKLPSIEHDLFCRDFALFQKIILRQKSYGKIDVTLPRRVLKQQPILSQDITDTLGLLYKNVTAFQDDCVHAALTQISTFPLTAYYTQQKSGVSLSKKFVIHLVGAELQFEGDSLSKWEAFFLHLAPEISDLHIVFIGPELNTEKLPIEIISRTRMCNDCRHNCRGIRFDFQCKMFYHDYCTSASYAKPDLIYFFNASLHRPGFRGFDTWTKTVKAAINSSAAVVVTACNEMEASLDLQRIMKVSDNDLKIIQPSSLNPYASTNPERNCISDVTPIMFRNHFYFIVQGPQDLIQL